MHHAVSSRVTLCALLCCSLIGAGDARAQIFGFGGSSNADGKKTQQANVFVTINGEPQSQARADLLLSEQLARGAADTPELREAVKRTLVTQAVMAQVARQTGLDRDPAVQARLELSQQNLLAKAWQQKVLQERPPREDEMRAEYDRQLAALGDTDYRLRHILVSDEATARSVLAKIRSGGNFDELAMTHSLDMQTRERGGLADWTNAAMLIPALANALKPLKNGQMSPQPVKSDAGWHVLKREDSRPFLVISYEQAKGQIQATIAGRLLEQRVRELVEKAVVK